MDRSLVFIYGTVKKEERGIPANASNQTKQLLEDHNVFLRINRYCSAGVVRRSAREGIVSVNQ